MKKSTLAILACVVSCSALASRFYYSEENVDHSTTPLSLSIATPLQLPGSTWNVYGLALNVFYAQHHEMYGIDLGLVSFNRDNFGGIQLQGAVGWSNVDATGLQVSGLANSVLGNGTGLQFASAVNYNRGDFIGGQFATVNYNGAIYGFQAGAFNYNKGVCKAFQFGGANANINEYRGCSIGALNYAVRFRGFQLGLINSIGEVGRGVQIGLFNAADNYIGLQIGLLNIIERGSMPIMCLMNAQF